MIGTIAVDTVNGVGSTLSNLPALTVGDGTDGSVVVYVRSRKRNFILHRPCTMTADHDDVESVSDISDARWIGLDTVDLSWPSIAGTAKQWYIDPINGGNDNDGVNAPVKTAKELSRRFAGLFDFKGHTFNVLNPLPVTDRFDLGVGTDAGNTASLGIVIQGQRTVVAPSLVVASVVARNPAADQPQAATVTGFDWAPHVGKIAHKVGTDVYAIIAKDLGNGQALFHDPINTTNSTMQPFLQGDTLEVIETTDLGGGIHCRGDMVSLRVRDCTLDFTKMQVAYTADSAEFFCLYTRCTFKNGGAFTGGGNSNFTCCSFLGTSPTTPSFLDFFIPGVMLHSYFKDCTVTFHGCKGTISARQLFFRHSSVTVTEHCTLVSKGDVTWMFDTDDAVTGGALAAVATAMGSSFVFNSGPLAGGNVTTTWLFNTDAFSMIFWQQATGPSNGAPHLNIATATQSLLAGKVVPNDFTNPQVSPALAFIGSKT